MIMNLPICVCFVLLIVITGDNATPLPQNSPKVVKRQFNHSHHSGNKRALDSELSPSGLCGKPCANLEHGSTEVGNIEINVKTEHHRQPMLPTLLVEVNRKPLDNIKTKHKNVPCAAAAAFIESLLLSQISDESENPINLKFESDYEHLDELAAELLHHEPDSESAEKGATEAKKQNKNKASHVTTEATEEPRIEPHPTPLVEELETPSEESQPNIQKSKKEKTSKKHLRKSKKHKPSSQRKTTKSPDIGQETVYRSFSEVEDTEIIVETTTQPAITLRKKAVTFPLNFQSPARIQNSKSGKNRKVSTTETPEDNATSPEASEETDEDVSLPSTSHKKHNKKVASTEASAVTDCDDSEEDNLQSQKNLTRKKLPDDESDGAAESSESISEEGPQVTPTTPCVRKVKKPKSKQIVTPKARIRPSNSVPSTTSGLDSDLLHSEDGVTEEQDFTESYEVITLTNSKKKPKIQSHSHKNSEKEFGLAVTFSPDNVSSEEGGKTDENTEVIFEDDLNRTSTKPASNKWINEDDESSQTEESLTLENTEPEPTSRAATRNKTKPKTNNVLKIKNLSSRKELAGSNEDLATDDTSDSEEVTTDGEPVTKEDLSFILDATLSPLRNKKLKKPNPTDIEAETLPEDEKAVTREGISSMLPSLPKKKSKKLKNGHTPPVDIENDASAETEESLTLENTQESATTAATRTKLKSKTKNVSEIKRLPSRKALAGSNEDLTAENLDVVLYEAPDSEEVATDGETETKENLSFILDATLSPLRNKKLKKPIVKLTTPNPTDIEAETLPEDEKAVTREGISSMLPSAPKKKSKKLNNGHTTLENTQDESPTTTATRTKPKPKTKKIQKIKHLPSREVFAESSEELATEDLDVVLDDTSNTEEVTTDGETVTKEKLSSILDATLSPLRSKKLKKPIIKLTSPNPTEIEAETLFEDGEAVTREGVSSILPSSFKKKAKKLNNGHTTPIDIENDASVETEESLTPENAQDESATTAATRTKPKPKTKKVSKVKHLRSREVSAESNEELPTENFDVVLDDTSDGEEATTDEEKLSSILDATLSPLRNKKLKKPIIKLTSPNPTDIQAETLFEDGEASTREGFSSLLPSSPKKQSKKLQNGRTTPIDIENDASADTEEISTVENTQDESATTAATRTKPKPKTKNLSKIKHLPELNEDLATENLDAVLDDTSNSEEVTTDGDTMAKEYPSFVLHATLSPFRNKKVKKQTVKLTSPNPTATEAETLFEDGEAATREGISSILPSNPKKKSKKLKNRSTTPIDIENDASAETEESSTLENTQDESATTAATRTKPKPKPKTKKVPRIKHLSSREKLAESNEDSVTGNLEEVTTDGEAVTKENLSFILDATFSPLRGKKLKKQIIKLTSPNPTDIEPATREGVSSILPSAPKKKSKKLKNAAPINIEDDASAETEENSTKRSGKRKPAKESEESGNVPQSEGLPSEHESDDLSDGRKSMLQYEEDFTESSSESSPYTGYEHLVKSSSEPVPDAVFSDDVSENITEGNSETVTDINEHDDEGNDNSNDDDEHPSEDIAEDKEINPQSKEESREPSGEDDGTTSAPDKSNVRNKNLQKPKTNSDKLLAFVNAVERQISHTSNEDPDSACLVKLAKLLLNNKKHPMFSLPIVFALAPMPVNYFQNAVAVPVPENSTSNEVTCNRLRSLLKKLLEALTKLDIPLKTLLNAANTDRLGENSRIRDIIQLLRLNELHHRKLGKINFSRYVKK